ncbi:MAG: YqjD family protein [Alphaproteobacteria bacterium]
MIAIAPRHLFALGIAGIADVLPAGARVGLLGLLLLRLLAGTVLRLPGILRVLLVLLRVPRFVLLRHETVLSLTRPSRPERWDGCDGRHRARHGGSTCRAAQRFLWDRQEPAPEPRRSIAGRDTNPGKDIDMAREDRETRRLKSSVRSLQSALATIAGDIETIGQSGKTAGLEQARAKLDDIREQVGDLVNEQMERAEEIGENVRRQVVDNPFTAVSVAFVAGLAAAVLLGTRR